MHAEVLRASRSRLALNVRWRGVGLLRRVLCGAPIKYREDAAAKPSRLQLALSRGRAPSRKAGLACTFRCYY
ncbi:hypothetical protein PG985_010592 [Apiospora marii]|uniref:Uncharacterized protein n=1 Tax=Apiospora marii TaxID=335849 RepID=A0ABR1T1D3_9PEZI